MPPFFTPKFDIASHPRYSMLDEADKENNTFYLEENVFTETEGVTVDLSEFYNETVETDSEDIEIMYCTNENGIVRSAEEMISDIPMELRLRLENLSVYAVG